MNQLTVVTSSVMRLCGLGRSVANRQGGAKAWPSCRAGGWRRGCEGVGASLPPPHDWNGRRLSTESTMTLSACWPRWLWLSCDERL